MLLGLLVRVVGAGRIIGRIVRGFVIVMRVIVCVIVNIGDLGSVVIVPVIVAAGVRMTRVRILIVLTIAACLGCACECGCDQDQRTCNCLDFLHFYTFFRVEADTLLPEGLC
ncbi:MAG: hypothetical protein HYU57_09455 [Micavibrio aeruginosavorus]|nr:hypothetical protein [Micavibrio aeruginosavorus]